MIKITEEMRTAKQRILFDLETQTDRRIEKAVQQGLSKAVFPVDRTDLYFNELKERYEKYGYRVIPVGVVGGVRQLDYYITW